MGDNTFGLCRRAKKEKLSRPFTLSLSLFANACMALKRASFHCPCYSSIASMDIWFRGWCDGRLLPLLLCVENQEKNGRWISGKLLLFHHISFIPYLCSCRFFHFLYCGQKSCHLLSTKFLLYPARIYHLIPPLFTNLNSHWSFIQNSFPSLAFCIWLTPVTF